MAQAFPTSSGVEALTSECSAPIPVAGFQDITVIDTPGFFESKEADVQNTLNLLKLLSEQGSIGAVLFVTKEVRVEEYTKSLLTLLEKIVTKEVIEDLCVHLFLDWQESFEGGSRELTFLSFISCVMCIIM